MRELVLSNVAYWVREFHVDGFRLDAAQQIFDVSPEHILAALTRVARDAGGAAIGDRDRRARAAARAADAAGGGRRLRAGRPLQRGLPPLDARGADRHARGLPRPTTAAPAASGWPLRCSRASCSRASTTRGSRQPPRRAGARSPAARVRRASSRTTIRSPTLAVGPPADRRHQPVVRGGRCRRCCCSGRGRRCSSRARSGDRECRSATSPTMRPTCRPRCSRAGRSSSASSRACARPMTRATVDASIGRPAFEACRLDHDFDPQADPIWQMYRDLTTAAPRRRRRSASTRSASPARRSTSRRCCCASSAARPHDDRLLIVNLGSGPEHRCAPRAAVRATRAVRVVASCGVPRIRGLRRRGHCGALRCRPSSSPTGQATTVFRPDPGAIMTTRALLLLKKLSPKPSHDGDAPLEWLVTNGLGGYASGSVDGPPMRRFHGLLVAALPAPLGRVLLLHALQEVDRTRRTAGAAACSRAATAIRRSCRTPTSACRRACRSGRSTWPDGVRIEQSVMMPHGQNTVHVRYRLTGATRAGDAAAPAVARLPAARGRWSTPEQHAVLRECRVAPTRYEFTRADRRSCCACR